MYTPPVPTRFVCLANSFKHHERCIAGIELDNQNNPKILSGVPGWIRPISETEHGEVNKNIVSHINLLDIVELKTTGGPENTGYQAENRYFDPHSIKRTGSLSIGLLDHLCNQEPLLFGNRGKAVHADDVIKLSYSLMLIHTDQFKIVSGDKPGALRIIFMYKGQKCNFPITDPALTEDYKKNEDLLVDIADIYLCISLGLKFENDFHYKLVAGVMY
jgi:hypothetical protein